jgi:hypothetical protein
MKLEKNIPLMRNWKFDDTRNTTASAAREPWKTFFGE